MLVAALSKPNVWTPEQKELLLQTKRGLDKEALSQPPARNRRCSPPQLPFWLTLPAAPASSSAPKLATCFRLPPKLTWRPQYRPKSKSPQSQQPQQQTQILLPKSQQAARQLQTKSPPQQPQSNQIPPQPQWSPNKTHGCPVPSLTPLQSRIEPPPAPSPSQTVHFPVPVDNQSAASRVPLQKRKTAMDEEEPEEVEELPPYFARINEKKPAVRVLLSAVRLAAAHPALS